MPWTVKKTDECPASKPWGVVKDSDGTVEGCHETEEAANAQMRALYASEKDAAVEAVHKAHEVRHKVCPIVDAKALSDGEVTAMFSVFGNVDLVGDRILPGAFTKTLKRWKESDSPVPVIVSHQWDDMWAHIGYANPGDVKQTPRGVLAKAILDVDDNPLAKQAHKLMKRGTLKGWSFGYTVPEGGEKLIEEKGAMVNEITDLDLIEIGPTLKGANPEAQLQAAKSWLALEEERGELGTGRFSVHFARALDPPARSEAELRKATDAIRIEGVVSRPADSPEMPPEVAERLVKDLEDARLVRVSDEELEDPEKLRAAFDAAKVHVVDSEQKSSSQDNADGNVPAEDPRGGKANTTDPLRKRYTEALREHAEADVPRIPTEPEKPRREPPSEKALRERHRDLMLGLLTE